MSEIPNTFTGRMRIRCDDCGYVTEGISAPPRLVPPSTWTTIRVTSTDQEHGKTLAWHFCPRCTVVVIPGEPAEPGFVDDRW
jgi:hypothetical protein